MPGNSRYKSTAINFLGTSLDMQLMLLSRTNSGAVSGSDGFSIVIEIRYRTGPIYGFLHGVLRETDSIPRKR